MLGKLSNSVKIILSIVVVLVAVYAYKVYITKTAEVKQIRIVGSSTVYPFTTLVAERFGKSTKFKTPIVESTGSGGGFKIFCSKYGQNSPDFTDASRKIKLSEKKRCQKNGISFARFIIGLDGIAFAQSNKAPIFIVTIPQLYQAMAKKVKINGKMVDNPYKKWSDIDPSLPNTKIEIIGPPPSSGTRDVVENLVMKRGAGSFGIKQRKYSEVVREDGAYIEAGEDDNLIVAKLQADPKAIGVFGYSYYVNNRDKLNAALINGIEPTYQTISGFQYPLARYLNVYINTNSIKDTPSAKRFLRFYISDDALGKDGYLAQAGLIPLPKDKRQRIVKKIRSLL